MGRVCFVAEMGADERRSEEQIEEDLSNIPGLLDVFLEVKTGEVTILGIADAATLKAQLEARLNKPVKILFDVSMPPEDEYCAMQQPAAPPHVPWSPVPAPPPGPYVGPYNQPPHAPPSPSPPPYAGYYHTPYYGGRPYNFKDDYYHGCSCSIQ